MVNDSTKSSVHIATRITEAILAQRLAPGTRLVEQQLCEFFDVSRTLIREALTRLVTRGIVTINPRRGWFIIEPTASDARDAFEARRVIELGLLRHAQPMEAASMALLRQHLEQEQAAIAGTDSGTSSYLLGDFHVCLCECLGNQLLAATMRDLTARTTLIAMLYQSPREAQASYGEHVAIVDALAEGDLPLAEALMRAHLDNIETSLHSCCAREHKSPLRRALSPLEKNDRIPFHLDAALPGTAASPISPLKPGASR